MESVQIHELPVGTWLRVFFPGPIEPQVEGFHERQYWGRQLYGRLLWPGTYPPNVRSVSLHNDPIFNSGDPCLDVVGLYQKHIDAGLCRVEVI